jgi:hypothetical protein
MVYLDMADVEMAHICLVIEYGNTFKKRMLTWRNKGESEFIYFW